MREEIIAEQQQSGNNNDIEVEFVQVAPISSGENASSALPQILHLSYKNRGQYYLDHLAQSQHGSDTSLTANQGEKGQAARTSALAALEDFGDALDKDEDDRDLWRKAANVGQMLGSDRISRFCLEGVLDEDENGPDDLFGASGVEAALVRQDLKRVRPARQLV